MMMQSTLPSRFVLPLPRFVFHRYTSVFLAGIHLYLSVGHLSDLFGGDVQWTHFWKGFGSLGGASLRPWRHAGLPNTKISCLPEDSQTLINYRSKVSNEPLSKKF
jgi:hypothetical protein